MLTITITPRAVLLAAALALACVLGFYATDAIGSGTPDSILQGDTDCDGDVDANDALNDLRHVGGLDVQQNEPCPDVGTLAAIPGPQGPQGEQGPPGPQGETGLSEIEYVEVVSETNSNAKNETASCPEGKTLIGGGGAVGGMVDEVVIKSSSPDLDGDFWYVSATDEGDTGLSWRVLAYAICANVSE